MLIHDPGCREGAHDLVPGILCGGKKPRAVQAMGRAPLESWFPAGADVISLRRGGEGDSHAQPSEDPEPQHCALYGRHVGVGDPTADQVPGR